jgi:nucleotide-binding universal stress UspA family protein
MTDLVVMTTHGRGALSRFWLGSVADEVMRMSTTPVISVRPKETAVDLASEEALRNTLIPLDGSAQAERILEAAVGWSTVGEAAAVGACQQRAITAMASDVPPAYVFHGIGVDRFIGSPLCLSIRLVVSGTIRC